MRIACLLMGLVALPALLAAETDEPSLRVSELVIASDVDAESRSPLGIGSEFPSDLYRVFCYTRITGADVPTRISHVWYHRGETKARVDLPVDSADWRTWSSKRLLPGWRGDWQVRILDEDGLVLDRIDFRVVHPDSLTPMADEEGARE